MTHSEFGSSVIRLILSSSAAHLPSVAEQPREGEETADRLRTLLDRQGHANDRAWIVTTRPRVPTPVFGLDRGPDYKLRIIEPPRGVDYKIVRIRPDRSVEYKLRILGPGGRDIHPAPLPNGGKTIIIDPRRGRRRE